MWVTNQTRALRSSDFVNHWYDYRLNWMTQSTTTIINDYSLLTNMLSAHSVIRALPIIVYNNYCALYSLITIQQGLVPLQKNYSLLMFEFILGVCFIFLGKWVGRKAVTVALLQWWLSPMSNETLDLKSLKVVASLYHVYTTYMY